MIKSSNQSPLRQDNNHPLPFQPEAAATASQVLLQKNNSSGKNTALTKAFGLPLHSLIREPEDHIPPPPIGDPRKTPAATSSQRSLKENSFDSPIQSPVQQSQNTVPMPLRQKETSFPASPLRLPLPGAESTSPPFSKSPGRDGLVIVTHLSSPILQPERSPEKMPVSNRMETATAQTASNVGGVRGERMRVESGVVRWVATRRAEVGLRVSEVILCLISFSVMSADKTSGWAGDSFDRYQEFRYCISMNVIAFVYAMFQVYAQFHHRMKKRHIIDRPLSYYLDFSIDQVLAYLLMSASSSAAARNDDWVSMFGSDKFTDMINASIAMSFLAFFAFAFSSLISAYKLFSWNT